MSCKISGAFAAMRAMMTPDDRLTTTDRAIYALIVFRSNGARACYKSHEDIMADLPSIKTRQTVSTSTNKLGQLGYLGVRRRRYGANHYTVLDPDGRLYAGSDGGKETVHQQPANGQDWSPPWYDPEPDGGKETVHHADDDAGHGGKETIHQGADDGGKETVHRSDAASADHVKESDHDDVKQTGHQESTPKVHTRKEGTPTASRARGGPIPDDWAPNAKSIALGTALGLTPDRIRLEADAMRDWAIDAGKLGRDWHRRFDNWLREEAKRDRRHVRPQHRNGTDGTLGVYDTIRRDWNLPTFLKPDFDDEPAPIAGQELLQ